jgi:hypothetical protein
LLVIGSPIDRQFDAAADNRPDVFIAHFHEGEGVYVPARIFGMSATGARPTLDVQYWAEIETDLPVELRDLVVDNHFG